MFNSILLFSPHQNVSKESIKALKSRIELFEKIQKENFVDLYKTKQPLYEAMAEDIIKQRKRLGGNWAIAEATFSRKEREFLRNLIGNDLVFIVLNMTEACQISRLSSRHGNGDSGEPVKNMLNKLYGLFEPAGDDELNAYNITIAEDMTPTDVLHKIMTLIENI